MESKKRWQIGGLGALVAVIYGWSLSPVVLVIAPILAVAGWILLGRFEPSRVRQRRLELLHSLPEALDLVTACLRAGQPLSNAIQTVSTAMGPPIRDQFDAVTNAMSVGMSQEQAWRILATDPVMGGIARDISRSTTWGTAMTDVLTHHSGELRTRSKLERLGAAKAVGVKGVIPLGVCYLPAFILLGVVPVIVAGLGSLGW